MKKLLNKEIVEQAIADIKAAGNKPTIERIRKITGGSPKTIIAIKRLINDSEHDSNNDNIPIQNDSKHDSKHDNALSLDDINILINTRIEQIKNELLSELKKSNFDSVSSEQMNQTIVALKTENIELSNQLEKQAGLVQKLTTDNNQLVLKNQNKFETIERLQADIKRLEETNSISTTRSTEAEKERNEALKEVVTLASENTELRRKLEAVSATEIEPQSEPIDTTEPEQNDSKNEPENKPEIKFTLDEAQERFFELRKKFPSKKQKEYLKILDSEGYTNTEGNSVGAYNLNRWEKQQRLK